MDLGKEQYSTFTCQDTGVEITYSIDLQITIIGFRNRFTEYTHDNMLLFIRDRTRNKKGSMSGYELGKFIREELIVKIITDYLNE